MLSYQHGYHAGNPADVHKHIALVLLLGRLRAKDKPYCYIDSHAGRGLYDLEGPEAQKTGEAERGILGLAAGARTGPPDSEHSEPPAVVRDYLRLVAASNRPGQWRYYPGSPAIARALLRDQDRAVLLERHPQEVAALKQWAASDQRLSVHARDSFEGLPALLPPPIRRGLVLIDPSYEMKSDYDEVAVLLRRAFERWSTGIFALWYPLLAENRHNWLLRKLRALDLPGVLSSEYRFADVGLLGSGLVIVNTPWRLDVELRDAMEFIGGRLPPAGAVPTAIVIA